MSRDVNKSEKRELNLRKTDGRENYGLGFEQLQ